MIKSLFQFISHVTSFLQITYKGYFEHFLVGLIIGGLFSYFIFKKTSNRIKSIVFGILVTTLIGTLKEVIDPYRGGSLDKYDLIFTFLGGVVGAVIILHKKK